MVNDNHYSYRFQREYNISNYITMEPHSTLNYIDSDDEENTELVITRETSLAAKRLTVNDTECVDTFSRWLCSLDGGSREKTTADVYRKSVLCILGQLGGFTQLHRCKDLGRDDGYFEFLLDSGMQPGTVKSFLHGLKAFADFLEWREDTYNVSSNVTRIMRQCASRWLKTVSKIGKARHQQFRFEESQRIDKLITAIPEFLLTKRAEGARKLLLSARGITNVDQFQDTRDLIILRILLGHGHRTGVIINATLADLSASPVCDNSIQTVFVSNHKTSTTYGPAAIVLDTELRTMLNTHIRRRLSVTGSTDVLFAHHNGQKMTSNDVCRGLQRLTENDLVTPTRLRKVVATKLLGQGLSSSSMNDVSVFMGHLPRTQLAYYDYRNKVNIATKVHSQIVVAMGLSDSEPSETNQSAHSPQPSTSQCSDERVTQPATPPCHEAPDQPLLLPSLSPEHAASDQLDKPKHSHKRRAGYLSVELACINRVFANHKGKSLLFKEIRQMLSGDQEGQNMLIKYKIIQLRDKVRSMRQ